MTIVSYTNSYKSIDSKQIENKIFRKVYGLINVNKKRYKFRKIFFVHNNYV